MVREQVIVGRSERSTKRTHFRTRNDHLFRRDGRRKAVEKGIDSKQIIEMQSTNPSILSQPGPTSQWRAFALTNHPDPSKWHRRVREGDCNKQLRQTHPCAPKSLPGLLCHYRPHPTPRGYQENNPLLIRTGHEDHSATSPLKVARLRGGLGGRQSVHWASVGPDTDGRWVVVVVKYLFAER